MGIYISSCSILTIILLPDTVVSDILSYFDKYILIVKITGKERNFSSEQSDYSKDRQELEHPKNVVLSFNDHRLYAAKCL